MPASTFPLTGPISVVVRIGHGSVAVRCADGVAEARVEVTPHPGAEEYAERITVALDGDTLTVTAPRQGGVFDMFGDLWRRSGAVDVAVTVPNGTPLRLATFTAEVRVTGRSGATDVATGSARIDVDEVDGDLRLRCGTSTSVVQRVHGSVQLRSGAGDVRLGQVDGDLHCGFGSGRLDVDIVRGRVHARTGAGSARLGAVHGDVDLASGSGGVRVGLPAGVTARLDLQTGSGSVHTELPVQQSPGGADRSITIRARTGTGDVHLVRAA